MRPTILLVNDDGVSSLGLLIMKDELEKLGHVTVVAPRDKRSGAGKSITVHNPIKMMKVQLSDGSEAYAITGTPADAYFFASDKILRHTPDLLVSGINLGDNVGIDSVLSSGTMGAAFEAAIHGVPAISASCYVQRLPTAREDGEVSIRELKLTASITAKVAEYVLKNGMPEGIDVISINVPKGADPRKIKITKIYYKGYRNVYIEREEGYEMHWDFSVHPDAGPDTDLYVVRKEGYISITPIKIRFFHEKDGLKDLLSFLLSSAE